MDEITRDVAVIGAGTAGLNATREAHRAGRSWVLIESGPYGTTCARVGCMPSKLLIAAAEAAHGVRTADRFGVRVGDWRIDGEAVMARVRRLRDEFAGGQAEATERLPEDNRIKGRARFVDDETLVVGDHTRVRANAVVIAAGSSPWIPPSLDAVKEHVQTSDDIFDWPTLPRSAAVLGTGIIALELGQALSQLGVRVSFFNPFDELGPFQDPEVKEKAREVLCDRLDLHLESEIEEVARMDRGFRLRWKERDGDLREETYETVLAAAGRRPNLEDLDLEAAGLDLDDKGIPRHDDQTMRCGDSRIFIAGDACGHLPLLHEASDEGRIAGANAARYPKVQVSMRRAGLAVVFTDPQMAIVGGGWKAVDPDEIVVGQVSYDDQGRARVMGVNAGLVRVYADRRTCRIVGAELFGPRVEHTAHLLAWAVQYGLRVPDALRMPFYHPVFEEGIRSALRDLAKKLRVSSGCPPEDFATAPGQ